MPHTPSPSYIWTIDYERQEAERQSGGRRTIIKDAKGFSNAMVVIPRVQQAQLNDYYEGSDDLDPFVIGGRQKSEIFVSQFPNFIIDGNPVSCARAPAFGKNLSWTQAMAACRAKNKPGEVGWHLMTNAEWVLLADLAYRHAPVDPVSLRKILPKGNTYWGSYSEDPLIIDDQEPWQTGIRADGKRPGQDDGGTAGFILTGTGPHLWYHDHTRDGVSDLVGNLYEYVAGVRVRGGEIQVIQDAADYNTDHSIDSPAWRAIDINGDLAAPGTDFTAKFDGTNATNDPPLEIGISIDNIAPGLAYRYYFDLTAAAGVNEAQKRMLARHGLFPWDVTNPNIEKSQIAVKNSAGEFLAARGGCFSGGYRAGLWNILLNVGRNTAGGSTTGFRACYYLP